jgi:hypothetical protein
MSNVLSFFRFFDLAFFVPGAFLLFVLKDFDYIRFSSTSSPEKSLGLVELVGMIAIAFALGLMCHAVARLFFKWYPIFLSIRVRNRSGLPPWVLLPPRLIEAIKRLRSFPTEHFVWRKPLAVSKSWFEALPTNEKHELARYFWYMRATCFNLAVALAMSSSLTFAISSGWTFVSIIAIPILVHLGFEYGESMCRAVGENSPKNPEWIWSCSTLDFDRSNEGQIEQR